MPAASLAIRCLTGCASPAESVHPLLHAHAHNDYEHARPLLDALDHGFCSVEADVWLVNGQLLVAHDLAKTKPDRTLEALYLEPLRERAARNGGRVFPGGPTITLLIDVKSDATNTWRALTAVLARYTNLLTHFERDRIVTNAVTAIISGNRALALMQAEPVRLAAYDGRLEDLDTNPPASLIPLVSDNWTKHFKWRGTGPMPDDERTKLKQIVARTHEQGRRLRLWSTAERVEVWRELREAGVDLINTDDLKGLERFFSSSK